MNESSRQERIIRTSVIGILVNLLIAAVKIMIGTLASVSYTHLTLPTILLV